MFNNLCVIYRLFHKWKCMIIWRLVFDAVALHPFNTGCSQTKLSD